MFYLTSYGQAINLDHLVVVKPTARRPQAYGRMSDGSEIDLHDLDTARIVSMTRQVVPAKPDDRAVVVTWYGEDDGDAPSHDAQDVPVIAWAVDAGVMVPVFAAQLIEEQQSVGLLMPDGSVCDLFGSTWSTRQHFIDQDIESRRLDDARKQQRQIAGAA